MLSEVATFRYRPSGELGVTAVYFDLDAPARLGRTALLGAGRQDLSDGVYIAETMRISGGYALGDPVTITSASGVRTFHVAGFFENLYLGASGMGVVGFGLRHHAYDRLAASAEAPVASALVQAEVSDLSRADAIATAAVGSLDVAPAAQALWTQTWPQLVLISMVGPNLYAASLVLFAVIVIGVILNVVRFLIRTTVVQDLTAIGVLSAIGATATQIGASLAWPFVATALLGTLTGVAASYLLVPLPGCWPRSARGS